MVQIVEKYQKNTLTKLEIAQFYHEMLCYSQNRIGGSKGGGARPSSVVDPKGHLPRTKMGNLANL